MHNLSFTKKIVATTALAVGLGAGPAAAEISVAATIKPIHSLVAAVMEGAGEPALLLDGPASPHMTALRPSQARIIEDADVVFAVGEGLEAFLQNLMANDDGTKIVELADSPGVELLGYRDADGDADEPGSHASHAGDDHEEDHDDEEHHGHNDYDDDHAHEHGEVDPHVWLDPDNARAMVGRIAEVLAEADPENAASYEENARTVASDLDALEGELAASIAPVKDEPFLVFHDAYQYFEERFGLDGLGAIVVNPETPPGARRLMEIRHRIEDAGVGCVFSEPQFEIGYVTTVLEGSGARTASLDPLGVNVEPGPDAYRQMLNELTDAFTGCLAAR